ncbi:MAG: hypothetical protein FWF22_10490, partial [Treponema sp.]|nr:hypothetical protein [Treponema sp.]
MKEYSVNTVRFFSFLAVAALHVLIIFTVALPAAVNKIPGTIPGESVTIRLVDVQEDKIQTAPEPVIIPDLTVAPVIPQTTPLPQPILADVPAPSYSE